MLKKYLALILASAMFVGCSGKIAARDAADDVYAYNCGQVSEAVKIRQESVTEIADAIGKDSPEKMIIAVKEDRSIDGGTMLYLDMEDGTKYAVSISAAGEAVSVKNETADTYIWLRTEEDGDGEDGYDRAIRINREKLSEYVLSDDEILEFLTVLNRASPEDAVTDVQREDTDADLQLMVTMESGKKFVLTQHESLGYVSISEL